VLVHEESIRIARPAAAVWALVGDPSAWRRWAGDIDDVQVDGVLAVGTTITYRHRGRRVSVILTAYDDERLVEIAGSGRSYEMHESVALAPDDDATDVSMTMGFEPTAWWTRLLAPLVVPFKGLLLGRGMRRTVHALRRAAEDG
jgi:carbon monoxide dehydrogenase subunit G